MNRINEKLWKALNTTAQCTYLVRLKENSNFFSEPFEDDPLDFDGASLGRASFAASLGGCALDEPLTQTHMTIKSPAL